MMKFGVVSFPGSNCDYDCYYVIKEVVGQDVSLIWHKETSVKGYDCIILPGGFSYGDHLRAGAIAQFSPVMVAVKAFASAGGLVLGICNGFQILLEANMLPGAMRRNIGLNFICKEVYLKIENNQTPYTNLYQMQEILQLPIAHIDGNYYADAVTLQTLIENHQIVMRYSDASGDVSLEGNPNGSVDNICGICNREGNVLGMMPHPERHAQKILGGEDGRLIFDSIVTFLRSIHVDCQS